MAKKAKKQRKKLDFSKAKKVMTNILKMCGRVSIVTLGIASMGAFLVIPFLHNYIDHTWAQWIWYPACAIFVVSAILDSHNTNKKPSKIPLFDFFEKLSLLPAIMIFGSAFIINYYNVAFSWWWAGFVIFAVYFPVFMFGIRKYLEKEKNYTPEQIKKSKKNCLKYVLFYWLIDLFYMSIFNYWQVAEQTKTPWLVLQFVFGGLAMVYIFFNLTRVFLANGEKHWWGLLQDFVFGIAITIYLIYLMPSTNGLQNVVSTIIAAVYGGLLTLVGVAWTIKDSENKRKEEERAKNIPYIKLVSEIIYDDHLKIPVKSYYDFNNPSDRKYFNQKQSYSIQISSFGIKNISNTHILFDSVHVNDNCYPFSGIIIEKDKTCQINICDNSWLTLTEPLNSIKLILHDMIGNNYCVECNFSNNPNFKPETGEEITDDGEKYSIVARSFVIQKVYFPKHLAQGDKK